MKGPLVGALALLLAAPFFVVERGLRTADTEASNPTPPAVNELHFRQPAGTTEIPSATVDDSEAEWEHVQRLLGQRSSAVDVAFPADPSQVVLAYGQRVTGWNTTTGLQTFALPRIWPDHAGVPGRTRRVRDVEVDGAGRVVAVAAADEVSVWDVRELRRTHTFPVRLNSQGTLAISRDGRVLLAKSHQREATVWSLDTGNEIRVFQNDRRANVTAVSLSADGSRAAVGWRDSFADVWDVDSGDLLMTASGHTASVRSVHLSSHGSRLATSSEDGTAKVWDVATGTLVRTLGPYPRGPAGVRLKANGTRIALALQDGSVSLWNVASGKRVRRYAAPMRKRPRPLRLEISRDGRRLAGIGRHAEEPTRGYSLWEAGTGRRLDFGDYAHTRPRGVQLSQDGRRVLAFHARGDATVLDVATGAELQVFVAPRDDRPRGRGVAYDDSPSAKHPFRIVRLIGDGWLALDMTRDGGFLVRDVDTGEAVRSFQDGPEPDYPFVLSPDHSLLVSGDVDGSVHIWDVATGRHMRTLVGHTGRVLSASLDLKNSMVATGGMDGVVRLWDVDTGVCLGAVPTFVAGAHAVSLSPDGRYLLTWRRGQPVRGRRSGPAHRSQTGSAHTRGCGIWTR